MSGADHRQELSALLDGELDPAAELEVRAWLNRDPAAQAELEGLATVRQLVRDLPPVDPPFGFYERLLREPRRRRLRPRVALGAAAALVASFVLLAGLTPVGDHLVPPVEAFAARHESMVTGVPTATVRTDAYEPMTSDELDDMGAMALPDELGGMEQSATYATDEVVHVMYGARDHSMSVYEQVGTVDWTSMPTYGDEMSVDGSPAWMMEEAGIGVLVVERHTMVYTVVMAGPGDELMAVAETLPEPPPPSAWDRGTSALRHLAEAFGLGG